MASFPGAQHRSTYALAAALLALCAVSVYAVAFIARERVAPRATTFSAFARHHGEPFSLAQVDLRGLHYFVWTGSLGSGPPCYVFDMRGTLVGWSPVSNDGHCEPMASAVGDPQSRHISVAQAEALIAASSAAHRRVASSSTGDGVEGTEGTGGVAQVDGNGARVLQQGSAGMRH